ncbi:MAG: hypothetical protein ABI321_00020 [Polyangia bacterium]
MASVDLTYSWQHVSTILDREGPRAPRVVVVPHEETDLHRVFCDDELCLDEARPDSAM